MPKKVRFFLKRSSKVEIGTKPVIVPFQLTTVLLLVIMIIISAFLFLRSDLFQIKKILVTSKIPDCATEEGLKLATEAIGASIIFYDTKVVEKKIPEKFYCLSQVRLIKKYPETVEIQLFDRVPVAAVLRIESELPLALATSSADLVRFAATQSAAFALDKTGILFKNLSTASALPKVYIAQNLTIADKISQKEILWLLDFLSQAANFNLDFGDFVKTSEGFIVGKTPDGKYFILSSGKDAAKTVASLQAILRQTKIEGANFQILDLRFEKPVLK